MATTYQCCFCGTAIEGRSPDVGGLLYTTAIHGEPEGQHEQQFYCHTNCLRERLHKAAHLYAVELCEIDEGVEAVQDKPENALRHP